MKILVAIDSFKGSATSKELNEALIDGLTDPRITKKISIPIADGGEGTIQAIQVALGGAIHAKTVPDLTGKQIQVEYLVTMIDQQKTAIIESASIIGIDKITPNEKTILECSTFGLGLLIKKIIAQDKLTNFYVTLGGSGTSDGGLGLLAGLGGELNYSKKINPLYSAKTIDLMTLQKHWQQLGIKITALADVTNPYVGANGFAKIFGPQKGGSEQQITEMDELAQKISLELNKYSSVDIRQASGAGAAGGLGGAILALGGTIKPGFQTISKFLALEEKIAKVDLVITGEGRLDNQTENGKVPYGVASIAHKYSIPTIALCGSRSTDIGEMTHLLAGAFSIQLGPISLKEALEKSVTLDQLKVTGASLVHLFLEGSK
ncbi:glycerate kinase family protein [Enterococcus sp. LJL99]